MKSIYSDGSKSLGIERDKEKSLKKGMYGPMD